jgi:O-antigen/teichoic acid export membrane protein
MAADLEDNMHLRETIVVSGGLLTQQVATFATGLLIARALGVDAYGVLATLKGLTTFLAIVTPLGLDLSMLKHGAFYRDRPSELHALSLVLRGLSGALNLILLGLIAVWVGPWLQGIYTTIPHFAYLCVLSMIGLVFMTDLQISSALFRVSGAVSAYAVAVNYGQPVLRLVFSGLAVFLGGGVTAILWVNAAMSAVTLVVLIYMDPSRSVPIGRIEEPRAQLSRILSDSIWMAMLLLVGQTMRFIDVIFLAAMTTAKITGEYTAMSNVAQLILIYPGAISQTLGPRIAFLHHTNDRHGIAVALEDYLRKASLLGGYLFGGIAVFGSQLDLVFGRQFSFSWQLAVPLAFGWFISATLGPLSYALSMTGRHKQDFIILIAGSVLLIVCLRLTIPGLQEVGAALSVAAAFIVANAMRTVVVTRTLKFNPIRSLIILAPLSFALIAWCCARLGGAMADRSLLNLLCQCTGYTALSVGLYLVAFATPMERRRVIAYLQPG